MATSRRALLALGLVAFGAALAAWFSMVRRTVWDDPTTPPPPLARAIAAFDSGRMEEAKAEVARFLRRYRAPAWEPRGRLLAAARLLGARQLDRVLEVLPRDFGPEQVLAPWASLVRGRALLESGHFLEAASSLGRAASTPGFPRREEALRLQAIALERAGQTARALDLLDREASAGLQLEAAAIARRAGDLRGARRRLAMIALRPARGDESERALEELSKLVPDPRERFEPTERVELLQFARQFAEAGRPGQALALLDSSREAPWTVTAISPQEALLRAELHLRLGRLSELGALVSRARAGGGDLADGAVYLEAKGRQSRGDRAGAIGLLSRLARKPRKSPWVLRAQLDLARLAEGRPSGQALAAYRRYREAAGAAADVGAVWREAWIAYELGRTREAEEGFERVLSRTDAPDSIRLAALYWKGRNLLARGRAREARNLFEEIARGFPSHYYGLLSLGRLGRPLPEPGDRPPRSASLPGAHPGKRWLEAARELRSVGLLDEAWESYGAAAADSSGAELRQIALEAADAAWERGEAGQATRFLELGFGDKDRIGLEELPARLWRLLLPVSGKDRLLVAARERGLEPALLAAVVLEESAFNPAAVSGAGAVGLLQLMPATGAELARKLGLEGFRPEQLYDPPTNLKLGCAYLRMLLDQHRSLPIALAAYNAGSSRAAAWVVPRDERDPERYVERIPIPDTRRYVKRILAAHRLYERIWGRELEAAGS